MLLPPWMGCQAITGLPLASHSLVSIYTAGWNEALRELSVLPSNPTQGTQPGLELEPSTLNIIGPCPSRYLARMEKKIFLNLRTWTAKSIFLSAWHAAPCIRLLSGIRFEVTLQSSSARIERNQGLERLNPEHVNPYIHIQILQAYLHTLSKRIGCEN